MVIENTNLKQTVYVFKCQDSTLVVKGKVNSITVGGYQHVFNYFERI